jgi:hypothetical protein
MGRICKNKSILGTFMTDSKQLLATWNRITGQWLEWRIHHEDVWGRWELFRVHQPFTESDLRLVLNYLLNQIKKKERRPACLRFSRLIGDPDNFQEELILARQAKGIRAVRVDPERAAVLRATGRSDEVQQPPAQPVSEVALNILRDFRKTLE